MTPKSLSIAAVFALFGASLWGWSVTPDQLGRWALKALVVPVLWGILELAHMNRRGREWVAIVNWHRLCIAWVSLMLALTIAVHLLVVTDVVDVAWAPVIRRIRGVVFGASLMIWGNYLPKLLSPWASADQPFDWQRVHRFVGWTVSIGGFAVILGWLLLPLGEARVAAQIIVILALGLALGRKLVSIASPPRRPTTPGADPA